MFVTPSMLAELINAKVFGRHDYSSVEVLMTGGSKPSKMVLEETQKALPQAIITNGFGKKNISLLQLDRIKVAMYQLNIFGNVQV